MKYFLVALVFITLACNLSFLPKADARGEEGAGLGGFREGDERGEGVYGDRPAEGLDQGEAVRGPFGGVVTDERSGAAAVRGPEGGEAVKGPNGGVAAERPVGVQPPVLPLGTRIEALPPTAIEIAVGDGVYYSDGGVYYQDCDGGFCVVADPTVASNATSGN